jgi:steroid delta-isomerase-like uncharacterized protein
MKETIMADAARLHAEMFEVAFARDFGRLRDLYHPDYVYMSGDGVEQPGADAGVAVAETYTTAFPDVAFELRRQYAPSDDVSIIEFTASGTHRAPLGDIPATGKRVTISACNVIETRDGKIFREREYYDTLAIMQQLGVIDGP